MSERRATMTVHDLTPYEVACLAGGPARAAQTAAVELIRRGVLSATSGGMLTLAAGPDQPPRPASDQPPRSRQGGARTSRPAGRDLARSGQGSAAASGSLAWPSGRADAEQRAPGSSGWPEAGSPDQQLEQQIRRLAGQPGGCSLRLASKRSRSWPATRRLESRLAVRRLIFSRRHRHVALAAGLAVIAVAVAAGGAFAAGWQAIPTARSPLGLAAVVVAAGLLARSGQRVTGSGRELLTDADGLRRLVLGQLPAGQPGAGQEESGQRAEPCPAGASASAADVLGVATGGLGALGSPELSALLTAHAPRGLISRAARPAKRTATHLVL